LYEINQLFDYSDYDRTGLESFNISGESVMNALRNHVLHEVALLGIKSLLTLQSIVSALKKPVAPSSQRGPGAASCRKALAGLNNSLSQTIIEEREDRL
jgi:hypothetical protein